MLTSPEDQTSATLLCPADPVPVEWANRESAAEVVLLCEHAGQAIPTKLADLGVSAQVLNSHRGWDVGAENLARAVAQKLKAPLILQRYSRLVIDCNRPPRHQDSIIANSDGIDIPANIGICDAETAERITEIFDPLDAAMQDVFSTAPRRAAFSIHSFTPTMNGQDRPWHAGLLCRADMPTAQALKHAIETRAPDKSVAINEPYQIDEASDWFIPAHVEPRGLKHTLIEIRNDELSTPENTAFWADTLAVAITQILEDTR